MLTNDFKNAHIDIMLPTMAYMSEISLQYEHRNACFPESGAARTNYHMYTVYTNDSTQGLCFLTLFSPVFSVSQQDDSSRNNTI